MNVLLLVAGLVGGAAVAAVVAVAARRLLGLHAGPARTVLAGGLGWAAFGLVGRRLHDSGEWWLFLSLLVGISVFATMGLVVVGDALFPSGGRPVRELRR
jgi:hypothetical protein